MISEIIATAADKMSKALESAKEDFSGVRTGRANPQLFQKVMVDYYGTPTALREMPNLDASPQNDGTLIRISLPDLTEERRKEYVKLVKAKAEDHRIAVRNIRRKGNDDLAVLKKDGEAGDDEIARAEKELDALTKTNVDAIDEALKRKEAELLEV